MNLKRLLPLLLVLAACTEETPSEVGGGIISTDDVRTFELLLDPAQWMAYDTTFSGYARPQDAPFSMIANKFGGVVDSNLLIRPAQPPTVINVRNAAGASVPDSSPRYFAGRLVIRFDTTLSTEPPAFFRAFRTVEPWHFSATWQLRVDTGNVQLPWAMPGGSRGAQVDTATWAAGDSIVFRVDSATIAQLGDTANASRGLLIVDETNNTRARIRSVTLRVQARSAIQQDTVFNFDVVPSMSAFIFNPQPPAAGTQLRVGGVPAWRSIIGVNENLRNLVIPCPGVTGCQIRLDRAHINLAELVLQPEPAPAGFTPEDSTFVQVRALLTTPGVPLQRSPLGVPVGNSPIIASSIFNNPAAASPVRINITNYIIALVDEDFDDDTRPASSLVLMQFNEPATFGFNAFQSGPRLRIVITAPIERAQ